MSEVKPYNTDLNKKAEVEQMFDNIAGKYDLLNGILSVGIDKIWRRKMIRLLGRYKPATILDVASGTGDVALEAARTLDPKHITGTDLSEKMLDIGRDKIKALGLQDLISMVKGDAENLPFEDNSFDAVTVAFGIRNFENLDLGLREMNRVLKAGGHAAILEFSKPKSLIFGSLYKFYFKQILPRIGRLTSGDFRAYSYLYESVQQFPDGEAFKQHLKSAGYSAVEEFRLLGGICTIYFGQK